jgi:hypothetical protein
MSTALRALRLSSFALLAVACNDTRSSDSDPRPGEDAPDAAPPDAMTSTAADWSCVGAPAPAVPEQIAITGRMFDGGQDPIADAVVEVLAVTDDAIIASAPTAADGTFAIEVVPGPDGLSAYLRASPEGRLPLYNFFDGPLVEDAEVPMLSLTSGELAAFYGFVLEAPLDDTKSTVSMVFKDCAAVPAADVEISLDPDAERIAYYSDAKENVDNALTSTDASGFAFGVNAPAEAGGLPLTVRGVAGEVVLDAAVESHPGALVSILVRP